MSLRTLAAIFILSISAPPLLAQSQQPPVLKKPAAGEKKNEINPCTNIAPELVEEIPSVSHALITSSGVSSVAGMVLSIGEPVKSSAKIESQDLTGRIQSVDSETANHSDKYVSVSVLTNPGPIGESYVPSGLGSLTKIAENRKTKFFYPSLFFDISASPLLNPVFQDNESDAFSKVLNVGADMKWMDVGIQLEPWCAGKPCSQNAVRLLEVMPNETRGGTKESIPAQAAGALTDAAKLAAPFFPATTFEDKLTAGSGGVTILFNNLFPPKVLTFFHTYIDSPVRFGWNFRQNKQKPEQASIMGLHRGVALLQAENDVTAVRVKYVALSEWDRDVNREGTKIDRRVGDLCVVFPPKKGEAPIEYDKLSDLSVFPVLIEKSKVLQILHISNDEYARLVDPANQERPLEATPNLAFVKKSSLEKYLGLVKKPEKEKDKEDKSH